jgi:hypothetical protein
MVSTLRDKATNIASSGSRARQPAKHGIDFARQSNEHCHARQLRVIDTRLNTTLDAVRPIKQFNIVRFISLFESVDATDTEALTMLTHLSGKTMRIKNEIRR